MNDFDQNSISKLKKALPYLRNVYSSLFASLTSLVFSFIIRDGYLRTYSDYESDLLFPTKVILVTLLPVIVVATVAFVYHYFDNLDLYNKREYFESKSKKPLIARMQYMVCFALPLLFSTLLLADSFQVALAFFFPSINIAVARILAIAAMVAMRLIQLWSLQDKWQAEIENPLFVEKAMFKRNRDMYLFKPHQMILQPIGFFFAFGALSIFVSYLSFPFMFFAAIITIINIFLSPEMWWTVFSVPVVIGIVVLAFILIYNTRRRRILLKKLKQMKAEGLAKVEIKGAKRLSATFTRMPLTVKITDREGEVYNCIVVANGEINAPMFFKRDEYIVEHGFHMRGGALMSRGGAFAQAVDISQLGGKENPTNLIFGFRTSHKLNFPEIEGHKVVILNPTPTTAFATDGHTHRTIDTGEVIGEYTIYTSSGLFNHIERQSRKGRRDYDY